MPATCAICLQPIVARSDVRVFDSEVMHRTCAALGEPTIGARRQAENARLRAELVEAQERLRRLEADWTTVRRNDETRAVATLREVERSLATALADRDAARATEAMAKQQLVQALRERDEAKAELAKRTPAPDVSPRNEQELDDTSARMSLLELD